MLDCPAMSLRPVVALLGLGLGLSLGCGGSAKEPVATAGSGPSSSGGDGTAGSGSSSSSAGDGTAGGGIASGGTANGGTAVGEGGAAGLVDCDPRKIACKRATPQCSTFEVPSVEGTCYGECVKIERCACSGPEQCPDNDQYTCWSKTHCGPYVH
jgi:hypothetical protein